MVNKEWTIHKYRQKFGYKTHRTNQEALHRNLVNVRENRISNNEWTIQRHWQHWAQDTEHPPPKKPPK
jgi:hypothetical protein